MSLTPTHEILKSIAASLAQGEELTLSDYFLKMVEPMSIVPAYRLKELIKATGLTAEVVVNPNIAFDHYQALIGNKLIVSESVSALLQNPDTFSDTFDKLTIVVCSPVPSRMPSVNNLIQ